MILEVYISLFAISILLLYLGYYSQVSSLKILGFGLIFVLGIFIVGYGDTVQYQTGTIINEVNSTYSNITYSYSTYSNQTLGFMFSTLAFLGWLSVFFDLRGKQ